MATMRGAVGSIAAERHVRSYLNDELLLNTRYTLAKNVCHLKAGDEVEIAFIEDVDGVYHAHTVCGHLVPITRINKPKVGRAAKHPESVEDMQIDLLNKSIQLHLNETGSTELVVWLNDRRIDVATAKKITENGVSGKKAKADFFFEDLAGNPTFFGSLKAGFEPRDFQQWGGVTEYALHPTVMRFVRKLRQRVNSDEFPQKTSIGMKLNPFDQNDLDLIMKSMFGSQCGNAERGIDNIDAIFGGQPCVINDGPWLTLYAPLIIENTQVFDPHHMNAQIVARYTSGRSNMGFKNCRIGVFPIGSRKVHEYI